MGKPFVLAFGGAVLLLAVLVGYIFYSLRGNHLVPSGRITKVRTVALDDASSAAILNFEATNPSDREMVVRFIQIQLHKADGSTPDNIPIAASDLQSLIRYHRELGALESPPMKERDRIAPHQTVKGAISARFEMPQSELDHRRDIRIVIEDVTGPKLELSAN